MLQLLLLVGALLVILLGAELFTNGVEWMGQRLDLAEGAVGSVLAAAGTAMPETMIPLVAIVIGAQTAHAEEAGIGVGAILGAPFMLATLAMLITGVAVLVRARAPGRDDRLAVDPIVIGRDLRHFAVAYALAIAAAFLPASLVAGKLAVAVILLGMYVMYVRAHLGADRAEEAGDGLRPLRFRRLDPGRHDRPPRLRIITLQVAAALAAIVAGAIVFVDAVGQVASGMGVDPMIVALVVAPIATELPEKFNSVIWIHQDKDTLSMGNITGAMVFQSCIPTVVALVLATGSWSVTPSSALSFASAGIAFVSTAAIFLPTLRHGHLTGRGLLAGGVFYVLYLGLVVASVSGAI
jgi:cation:H+ antiporter